MSCPVCGAPSSASDTHCSRCGPVVRGVPEPTGETTFDAAAAPTGVARLGRVPSGIIARAFLAADQMFGPRYRIIRLLGEGGMGAVYEAEDLELGVRVALKVIRPDITADPDAASALERRFKRELLLARQVTHKNVVRIHDLGNVDGIKYISMTYVDGSDLATILRREGTLGVERALRIVRSIAAGLEAAHHAGVVHRDLKPANIMIDAEGEALIMDFGIARSSGPADQAAAASAPPAARAASAQPIVPGATAAMTTLGSQALDTTSRTTIVGTVSYIAPEQAAGKTVDHRADIYALGLIAYDLLTATRQAACAQDRMQELYGRMAAAPPALASVEPAVPAAVDRIVMRCVQPRAADRYQSTAELIADLDRLDENGNPLPVVRRVTRRLVTATAALVVAMLAGTYYVTWRAVAPPEQHEPVSLVIADFQNRTTDPAFDGTLEPMLKIALEDAGFISAYDRSVISRSLGVPPPELLDARAAQELAVKQGLAVVVSGSIERNGSGFEISMTATQAVSGNVIADVSDTATTREQVLAVATGLASAVRDALGDETSESDRRFAMETLSATSLEVVRDYAAAALAMSNAAYEEALAHFARAAQRDPTFGLAHAGMAIASRNLDRQQDAEKYIKEAVSHLDSMTERERYRTRGLFYMITGDSQQCAKEFGDLVARYAADASARNNLALCLTYLRNIPQALAEMQQVVKILPRRALYRENLALYAAYGGNFQMAEQEARAIENPSQFARVALAFAQLGQGRLLEARETYAAIGTMDTLGASYRASGLGDLAMYEGRFAEAARIFAEGAAADLASKDADRAANKFAALAHAELLRQRNAAAIAAAEKALAHTNAVKIRFLAARVFIEAGATETARALAAKLASELQPEPQAYAKILDGEMALKNGSARESVRALNEANALLDTWIGHFVLGRAFLEAGAFTQADSEFDRCIRRRGETLALFLDEEATYAYFPPVYYYQGRVREALNNARFAESYRAYVAIRGQSKEDPLLPEVRRRAGG